jgi:ribonuclease HI
MLNIYTDGSCLKNGKEDSIGGWAFVVTELENNSENKKKECCGKLRAGDQTSNRAELEAVLHAFEYVYRNQYTDVTLYIDSTTAYDGIVGTAARRANRDIWEQIESVIAEMHADDLSFDVKHIPRCSNTFSQDADHLARTAANSLLIKQN